MTILLDDFLKLRYELPAIDVRSENEFKTGHIHNVVNIPLLNNEERIVVGTDYKQKGQFEAIKTGFRLVGPRMEQIILDASQIADGKEVLVNCWRGGMRSSNFCQLIGIAGIKSRSLVGGYKAYRQRAMETYETPLQLMVIGGKTGSGKSAILRELRNHGEQVIDLETLANHKGSVFGGLMMGPQPSTEQFQNDLFEELLKLDVSQRIWVEDESIAIGRIFLPEKFWRSLRAGPVFRIELPKEARIERLVKEYGHADRTEFLDAMKKILKRLGGQNFSAAKEKVEAGDMATAIDILLTYYDKAYSSGLENRTIPPSPVQWDGIQLRECALNLIQAADEVAVKE